MGRWGEPRPLAVIRAWGSGAQILYEPTQNLWAGIAQSVWRLATGWTVHGSIPGGWVGGGGGSRFSTHVQTGPGAHPVSYTMDTGSFPRVKRSGHGVDHPPPSSPKVKERVQLYFSPSGPSWPFRG